MSKHVDDLIRKSIDVPREKCIVEYMHENNKLKEQITELEKENAILKKALNLYVDWADECGIAWDNFPDMKHIYSAYAWFVWAKHSVLEYNSQA